MEYEKLGSTDLTVSKLGFGCWAIGGHGYGPVDDDESVSAIRRALDHGVTLFDTADAYGFGHSERVLAKALGARRKDVAIATKFGVAWNESGETFRDCSPARAVSSLEGSLKRLEIDCVPIYQIHWHDGKTPIGDTIEALKRCQQAGKIRHISCSNFPLALIHEAQAHQRIESLQCLYSLLQRQNEADMISCRESYNMGVIAYGTIVRGLLSAKFNVGTPGFIAGDTRGSSEMFKGMNFTRGVEAAELLKDIGCRYGKNSVQVAIRYVLQKSFVTAVIVGHKLAEQVDVNVRALGWNLDEEDMCLLDEYACRHREMQVSP
jgi:aryl-alcohol dehydrogenase-like predicted oxidoreductase